MHRNKRENKDIHHLYAIFDREREGLYKYGICGRPLRKDGSSPRSNQQVNEYNRVVGWDRFFAVILILEIPGREAAEAKEKEFIELFELENGFLPPGNE